MSPAPRVALDAAPPQSSAHLSEITPSERLAAALRVAVDRHADSLDRVRQAVGDYVRALRARGEPPQAVLVSVKDFVRRAPAPGAVPFEPADDQVSAERRERLVLADAVVRWAIDAYYGDGTA